MKIKYNKWLLLIIILGLILRLIGITTESYWFDEIYSMTIAKLSFPGIVPMAAKDVHPPLYYMISHLWLNIFGTNELAARSLSAVFSLATIPVLYSIAIRLFNKKVAYISTLIFAFSRINIFYSQECRMYTLLSLLVCISYFFMIKILQSKDKNGSKVSLLILYSLANTAMIYTHNFAFLILISQVIYILITLIRTKSVKSSKVIPFGISYIALFILYLPWFFILLNQIKSVSKGFWLPEISRFSGGEAFIELSGSIILAVIFFVLLVFAIIKPKEKNKDVVSNKSNNLESESPKIGTGMFWLWFVLPIALPLSVSYFLSPIFNARYLLLTSPALILLVAVGIDNLVSSKIRWAVVISILALSLIALTEDWTTNEKEDWRATSKYLDKTASKKDMIIVDVCREFDDMGDSQVLVEFYSKDKSLNYYSLATNHTDEDLDAMLRKLKNCKTVYFVKSHGEKYHNPMDSIIHKQGFVLEDSVNFENYTRRYLYMVKYAPNKYDLLLKKCTTSNSIKIEILTRENEILNRIK